MFDQWFNCEASTRFEAKGYRHVAVNKTIGRWLEREVGGGGAGKRGVFKFSKKNICILALIILVLGRTSNSASVSRYKDVFPH